jgi:Ammonium Transporter Family
MGYYFQFLLFEYVLFIDDPLNAAPLHMGAGIVGMLCVGFFANPDYVEDDPSRSGIVYGGNGMQLGYQLYGTVVYFVWSFGTSTILFYALHRMDWLRVSKEVELMGMDLHHHGGHAYPKDPDEHIGVDCIGRDSEGILPTSRMDDEEVDPERGNGALESEVQDSLHFDAPATTGIRKRPSVLLAGAI